MTRNALSKLSVRWEGNPYAWITIDNERFSHIRQIDGQANSKGYFDTTPTVSMFIATPNPGIIVTLTLASAAVCTTSKLSPTAMWELAWNFPPNDLFFTSSELEPIPLLEAPHVKSVPRK
jgi:hypothetical protein